MKNKNKNKIKIKEGALDVGIQSYQTNQPSQPKPSSSNGNVTVNTNALKKPSVVNSIEKLKKDKIDVTVVDEGMGEALPVKLKYLSEVEDADTGEVSKPFTINDKRYQMVRAITPTKEKVMGVYSLDEIDEEGNNIIYDINEFEENIAKKALDEEGVVEPEGPEMATLNPEGVIAEPADEVNPQSKADEMGGPSFAGFKHFIVNRKTGKARKFKGIEELAKAQMMEDEQYMGIRDFKKYVDEVLFGAGKKRMKEDDTQITNPAQSPNEEKMIASAEKLMKLINSKIPAQVVQQIKTNHIAQREVILAFAEMIGVPDVEINKIVIGLKDMARGTKTGSIAESTHGKAIIKVIKVKDIK